MRYKWIKNKVKRRYVIITIIISIGFFFFSVLTVYIRKPPVNTSTISQACSRDATKCYRKRICFEVRESLTWLRRNDKSSYVRKLRAQNFRRKFIPFVIVKCSRRPWKTISHIFSHIMYKYKCRCPRDGE